MSGVVIRGHRFHRAADVIDHFEGAFLVDRPLDAGVAERIKSWVRLVEPTSAVAAFEHVSAVVRLCDAAREYHWPMEPEELLTASRIQYYCDQVLSHFHPEAREMVRQRLEAVARAATRDHGLPPPSTEYSVIPLSGPYDESCMAGYGTLLPFQKTPYRRRILGAFLSLCAGAGVRSSELLTITASLIRQMDGFVVVDIPGDNQRTVPVLREYEEMLLRLQRDVPNGLLVGRVSTTSTGPLHQLKSSIDVPDWLPPIMSRRLRSTWMVHQVDQLTLPAFMSAAGIRDTRIADWLPHLPPNYSTRNEWGRLAGDPP